MTFKNSLKWLGVVALLVIGGPLAYHLTTPAQAQFNTDARVNIAGYAFNYGHITTSTTTTLKSGVGFLHNVCVNTKGATANTATIYDNTTGSGTVIGILDTTSNVACQSLDVAFSTGLTIVTAAGTQADLTVSYK